MNIAIGCVSIQSTFLFNSVLYDMKCVIYLSTSLLTSYISYTLLSNKAKSKNKINTSLLNTFTVIAGVLSAIGILILITGPYSLETINDSVRKENESKV